jgi:Uncharacterized conserved protein (DUF2285)
VQHLAYARSPESRPRKSPYAEAPLDPDVADEAPTASVLTGYDEVHLVTYLRLLDAEADDWKAVARIVLHLDPAQEPDRARRAWRSHLARAHWMTEHGYRHLLRGGAPH